MKLLFTSLLGSLVFCTSYSQDDSCNLQISLLTCGPGEDLYSVFGHSALRVRDNAAQTDIIYNYGTFDFEDPDFYVKFVRGKLLYSVSPQPFNHFVNDYRMENRSIIEQKLTLNCDEKQKLYRALQVNALEENKYYEYEFLFDNCSTRLMDIVKQNAADSVEVKRILPVHPPSFRDMLYTYLEAGHLYWSEFGIDLLLASRIDRKVKNEEAMFLPDYLMKGFDSSVVRNNSLVKDKKIILPSTGSNTATDFSVTPLMVTIALLLGGAFLTFNKSARWKKAVNVFDTVYFFLLGLTGCLMLFMWLGTEHELCRDNYNLLWAIPTHVIAAFMVSKNTALVRKYFSITAILCVVLVTAWPFLPQGMNSAFFPLVLLSGIRSVHRAIKNGKYTHLHAAGEID